MNIQIGDKVIVKIEDPLNPILRKGSIHVVNFIIGEKLFVEGPDGEEFILFKDEVSKVGKLQHLKIKDGDVVKCVEKYKSSGMFRLGQKYTIGKDMDEHGMVVADHYTSVSLFEVVSRSKEEDQYSIWKDLSDEEKKDLLLIQHEKGPSAIEIWLPSLDCWVEKNHHSWVEKNHHSWFENMKYRPKKEPEVVKEVIDLYVYKGYSKKKIGTIELNNGVPNKDSIQLET